MAEVVSEEKCLTESPVKIRVYIALPKGDKLDTAVQKAVECGVFEIVFFESDRTVVRLEGRETDKKIARWQKIAEEAAKQSGRGKIPAVEAAPSFEKAIALAAAAELPIFCYEDERKLSLKEALEQRGEKTLTLGGEKTPPALLEVDVTVARRAEDWLRPVSQGRRGTRKTTWFPPLGKMRPLPATASQGKSPVPP